jgi:RNA polymerase sigma-70 factor (ECF subfamily)
MADIRPMRDDLYKEAVASCGTALDRVARAYEADPDKRRDLLQEIHVALWQSSKTLKDDAR